MGEIVKFNAPPLPKLADSVEALNRSTPTAPITALVAQSLGLSSPDRDNQPSAPAETLDGSSPSSSVGFETSEGLRSQVEPGVYLLPASDCGVTDSIQIENSPHSMEENGDVPGEPCTSSRTGNNGESGFVLIDDDREVEQTELGWKSWLSTWSGPQQEPPKIQPTGVGAGLWNLVNTCFVNSILQCFTHTVPLIESLCSHKHWPCNCGNEEFCVKQVLQDHIELALRSSGDNISPVRFVDNLNYFSSCFQKYHQEDAQEFLQSFLDKLERCCLDLENKPTCVASQGVNIVQHVFGGRIVSKLRCCECKSFSDTNESSLCLSLEIKDVDDLASALESFTQVEKLEDKLTCDSCEEKVSKEKQLMLDKLPLVATFHLKRFENEGFFMEKIFKHVKFPLELDLRPYMSDSQENEVSTTYHLYALVEHIGSSLSCGHYISYVRSDHETWHKFDDSQVTRIEEGCVLSQDAYILFYAREGTRWFSSALELIKPRLEANMFKSSPKSVLDPAYREFQIDENIDSSRPDKPCNLIEDVSQSMENYASCCPELQEEVFHSAESNSEDCPFTDASELPEAEDYDKPCIESSVQEETDSCLGVDRAAVTKARVPVPQVQGRDCCKTHQEGTFQIQRSHLQAENKKESFKVGSRSKVAEAPERNIALSYLNSRPSQRTRMLVAAMAAEEDPTGSPTKKMKTAGRTSSRRRPNARRSRPHPL